MTRTDLIQFAKERGPRAWNQFKAWAFHTSLKLLLKRGVDPLTAFATAIVQTADESALIEKRSDRELRGFVRWCEMEDQTTPPPDSDGWDSQGSVTSLCVGDRMTIGVHDG